LLAIAFSALLALLAPRACMAAGPFQDPARTVLAEVRELPLPVRDTVHKEPQRLVAAGLALTLGTFGAHRLYLGTDAKVPIIYGLTFGGFGVLALIDLGQILFTKDLGSFRNNKQVYMWGKGRKEELTPP
jgi:TM2 domain-containing membrane protein YozV